MRRSEISVYTIVSDAFTFDRPIANELLLPEREAMRWVQKYIRQFGGDPSKVTMYAFTSFHAINIIVSLMYFSQLGREFWRHLCRAAYGRQRWRQRRPLPRRILAIWLANSGC